LADLNAMIAFRDAYGPNFYVGYLLDAHGNKNPLFSHEPGRDG